MNEHLSEDQIAAVVLGFADPEERGQLEKHLSGCAWCRNAIAAQRGLLEAAGEALRPAPPPDDLGKRMLQAVRNERRHVEAMNGRATAHSRYRAFRFGVRVALVAAVFVVGYLLGSRDRVVEPGVRTVPILRSHENVRPSHRIESNRVMASEFATSPVVVALVDATRNDAARSDALMVQSDDRPTLDIRMGSMR